MDLWYCHISILLKINHCFIAWVIYLMLYNFIHTENPKWIIWLIWAIVCHYTDKKTHFSHIFESFCPCTDPLWLKWVKWFTQVFLCFIRHLYVTLYKWMGENMMCEKCCKKYWNKKIIPLFSFELALVRDGFGLFHLLLYFKELVLNMSFCLLLSQNNHQ